jgi:hypothetical protein
LVDLFRAPPIADGGFSAIAPPQVKDNSELFAQEGRRVRLTLRAALRYKRENHREAISLLMVVT